jgi:hypothetical protein
MYQLFIEHQPFSFLLDQSLMALVVHLLLLLPYLAPIWDLEL